jgi:chromosome segregation ATPase
MPFVSEEDFLSELHTLCDEYVQARIDLDAKHTELKERYEEARTKALEKKIAADTAEAGGTDCSDLREREAELWAALDAALWEYEGALEWQASAEYALSQLLQDITITEQQIEYLESEIVIFQADIADLEESLAPETSDPELEELRAAVTQMQSDVALHQGELAELQGQVSEAEALVATREAETVVAEAKLSEAERAYEDNNEELDRCEALEEQAAAGVETLRREQEEWEERRDDLARNVGSVWQDEIDPLRDDAGATWDAYDELYNAAISHADRDGWDLPERCAADSSLEY